MPLQIINQFFMASLLCLLGFTAQAQQRFMPQGHDVVLSPTLHSTNPQYLALSRAEQQWRANRNDLTAALTYARAAFLIGLREGDLRWYGSAKAALQPWWNAPTLSAQGHFIRGLIKQGLHDFAAGLDDINQAIALEPQHAEFWSWRFALHILTSKVSLAQQDCETIATRFGHDEGQTCFGTLWYRTGQATKAITAFDGLVELAAYQDTSSQDWLRFHQGEALRTAGRYAQAQAIWENHLKANPQSHVIRLALVELLNFQGDYQRAIQYATTSNPSDALLVQSLIAHDRLHLPQATAIAADIKARLETQSIRQDGLIERPQIIYLLHYRREYEAALKLALANWELQNEPADAVLVLEAAIALQRPSAVRAIQTWMQSTGYQDPVLAQLLQSLTGSNTSKATP